MNIKNIFWDFDGVLLNSNQIRDQGFIEVLKSYPKSEVQQLLQFHKINGGLSRYVKFRYFFEKVRKEPLSDDKLGNLCQGFSDIMKSLLTNHKLLIKETNEFVSTYYIEYRMHIVSGSDQSELRYLCEKLGISRYFTSIHGSPTPKSDLVKMLLQNHKYNSQETLMIGDSINDYQAAKDHDLFFLGFNNPEIENKSDSQVLEKIPALKALLFE